MLQAPPPHAVAQQDRTWFLSHDSRIRWSGAGRAHCHHSLGPSPSQGDVLEQKGERACSFLTNTETKPFHFTTMSDLQKNYKSSPKQVKFICPLLELGQLLWVLLPNRMWLKVTLWVWVGVCSGLAASALTLLEDKRLLENESAHGERGPALLAEALTWVSPADAVWVMPAQSSPNCQPTELWANK